MEIPLIIIVPIYYLTMRAIT